MGRLEESSAGVGKCYGRSTRRYGGHSLQGVDVEGEPAKGAREPTAEHSGVVLDCTDFSYCHGRFPK